MLTQFPIERAPVHTDPAKPSTNQRREALIP
jgi:hypothetical protein